MCLKISAAYRHVFLVIAGRQVFLFFLFFPIFWESSYFSKKIPIFSYF